MPVYIRLRPHWPDEPIVQAYSDTDFYKFTMGQFIFFHYKNVQVTFGFKNRTIAVKLGHIIPETRLREELDHVRSLRYTNSELHYLRGTNEYSDRMFREPYLESLKDYQAPPYNLEYRGDYIFLEFPGKWGDSSPWEIFALEIINELYYRELIKKSTLFDKDVIYAEGKKRLWEKIQVLKKNPQITFSEFGTRRRFSRDWQDYVVGMLSEELPPTQFRGTSNVFLAMKYGRLPMGTNAHELQMVIAGLSQGTDEELRNSQNQTNNQWWQQYGEPLSICLPDTFGTDAFLRFAPEEFFHKWKGFRQDSGDPKAEGDDWIKKYQSYGIDSSKKMMVPSDGMELEAMLDINKYFDGRLITTFGWGSNLTNDLGLKPLSIVIKATTANGVGLVKLSNNPAKAMGDPEQVKRYIKVFGYGEHSSLECKY